VKQRRTTQLEANFLIVQIGQMATWAAAEVRSTYDITLKPLSMDTVVPIWDLPGINLPTYLPGAELVDRLLTNPALPTNPALLTSPAGFYQVNGSLEEPSYTCNQVYSNSV
jgi:hypothetical protein